MASAQDVLSPLIFTGLTKAGQPPVVPHDASPKDFIETLKSRALKYGWSDSKAANEAISALRNEAFEWYHYSLPFVLGDIKYETTKTSFLAFSKAFCSTHRILSNQEVWSTAHMEPQRPNEDLLLYLNRMVRAARSTQVGPEVDFCQAEDSAPPLPEPLKAFITAQSEALKVEVAQFLIDYRKHFVAFNMTQSVAKLTMRMVIQGIHNPQLRLKASDLFNKGVALEEFYEELQTLSATLGTKGSHASNATSSRKQFQSFKAAPVYKEEDQDVDGNHEAAAVKKGQSTRKIKPNSSKKGQKNRPNGNGYHPDGTIKFCNFCKRRFHLEAECKTKLAASQQSMAIDLQSNPDTTWSHDLNCIGNC